jgi:DNA mismatch repair protein MutS
MQIDRITTRNLEIISSINEDNISLYSILDKTTTSMGKRLLKDWLLHPLLDVDKINNRQRAISELVSKPKLRQEIKNILKEIADLERLCARLDLGIITPKDLINLKVSLKNLIKIKSLLKEDSVTGLLRTIQNNLIPLEDLISLIEESICQEKPGSMIKPGFNKELDEINQEIQSAKKWIEELQYNEIKRTGISSIKVGYNKVFGYYIEVTKPNLKYVPSDYIRKQTLSNAERFITPELKEKEVLVLQAKERIAQIEQRIFQDIKKRISAKIKDIQENSRLIALLDVLVGLTQVVIENNYTKALLNNQEIIYIKDGRHPVVEKFLNTTTSQFIPNDTILDNQNNQVLIITGPNMAGKSTYIRQVGIIVLMAQVFGYVPAKEATIGLVDKLFARVGATDIIYKGQSTFMVEMLETANILNNATKRSLIILDEIGRGTSTYDGISIAWAVIEYIIKKLKSKTLFATHYHELIELEKKYKNIKNYSLAVIESDNKELIFSHKIRRGGILKSYGIEVANLAGLPKQVIVSAREILTSLEEMHKSRNTPQQELSLFSKPQTIDAQREQEKKDKIIQILNSLDIDNLTGLAALQELAYLKKLIKEKED